MARSIFSERLTVLRKNKKMTQLDMADYLGLSRSTYTCYEVGNSMPTAATLCAIADLFDVSLDYLLGRFEDPTVYHLEDPEYSRGLTILTENYRIMDKVTREATVHTSTLLGRRCAAETEVD